MKLIGVVNDSFSSKLEKENNIVTVGYFYAASDNPFSFQNGFFIVFHASYFHGSKKYTAIGISTAGKIEGKAMTIA